MDRGKVNSLVDLWDTKELQNYKEERDKKKGLVEYAERGFSRDRHDVIRCEEWERRRIQPMGCWSKECGGKRYGKRQGFRRGHW